MELQFRAWDEAKQEFIYSDQITGGMWQYFKTLEDRGIRHFESEQYIGKQDKHGKDIYAGDRLSFFEKPSHKQKTVKTSSIVIFENGIFKLSPTPAKWNDLFLSLLGSQLEVVGHIHENGGE